MQLFNLCIRTLSFYILFGLLDGNFNLAFNMTKVFSWPFERGIKVEYLVSSKSSLMGLWRTLEVPDI